MLPETRSEALPASAGNLISGNTTRGVSVEGSFATGDLIEGNRIGTSIDAEQRIIEQPGRGTRIAREYGGTDPGAGNLISGNAFQGIGIRHWRKNGNVVEGNLIGTDHPAKPRWATALA